MMKYKNIFSAAVTLGSLLFSATSAQAFGAYLTDVNNAYGSSYTNCLVCHSTAAGGTDKGVTAYANQYRVLHNAALIATLDADNDGFTNGQEGVVSTDLNSLLSSPFTVAAASAGVSDKVLANIVVKGDATAVAQAFTDPYTLATTGKEVLGAQSLTINIAPVDVYYKTAGIDSTITLYNVDPYGQGTVSPMGTGWTANADGSLHVVALAPGATTATAVIVRTIPVVTPVGGGTTFPTSGDSDGEGDDGNGTGISCLIGGSTVPMLMLFGLLGLGFFSRAKKR